MPTPRGLAATTYFLLSLFSPLVIQNVLCTNSPYPNPLFSGISLTDFFDICTPASTTICPLNAPADFRRLQYVKRKIREQVNYYISMPRLAISCSMLVIILILMVHLAIVRHFDWRTLPIVNFYYDIELDQDKTNGVKYHQYIWMTYLVLRGNHAVFRGRDYRDINWHKYNRDVNFDYKSVRVYRFTFLDKKMLTKHLVEDTDKETTDMEFLHNTSHAPTSGLATTSNA